MQRSERHFLPLEDLAMICALRGPAPGPLCPPLRELESNQRLQVQSPASRPAATVPQTSPPSLPASPSHELSVPGEEVLYQGLAPDQPTDPCLTEARWRDLANHATGPTPRRARCGNRTRLTNVEDWCLSRPAQRASERQQQQQLSGSRGTRTHNAGQRPALPVFETGS